MIIKKLAVPLINDKLLAQAEHCYIATAGISDAGFDFVRTRLAPNCKIDIVTGLDMLTSPGTLRRIWRHYQDRISCRIYTRNFFHANVYIFDLPYRKAVAFAGSGNFTIEGLKDHEEIFYKVTDLKEIETLRSWFTGYYEFAEPVSELLIQQYEAIYPAMKQREIASRQEKNEVIEMTAKGFNWDNIKFKNQFFKKEDYLIFGHDKSSLNTPAIQAERESIKARLLELHELIKRDVALLKLQEDAGQIVNSVNPNNYANARVSNMSIIYGRPNAILSRYSNEVKFSDFITLRTGIHQKEVIIALMAEAGNGKIDRNYFQQQMNIEEYRKAFFKLLKDLGANYWIEIFGEKRGVEIFKQEDALWEFAKQDDWRYYTFAIGRSYSPDALEISSVNIVQTIINELEKLNTLHAHLKDRSLEMEKQIG